MIHWNKPILRVVVIGAILLVVAGAAWLFLRSEGLPEGFASGNGRIEAVEIDIATKTPGRVAEILVREGDFIEKGELLAKMDTATLEAQLREAKANLRRAKISTEAARAVVTQRKAERSSAEAVVAQRQAQLDIAEKNLSRSTQLVERNAVPVQRLDDDTAEFQAAKAALSAAQAQQAAAEAGINSAESDVVAAEANVEATQATIERIEADIADSKLRSPRDGRIQYRVAEPGEVLNAGGAVLNMVDLSDVYMTFFLPTSQAGRVAMGAEARIILDVAPEYVVPATISYVADVAQFTPKTVETAEEREKLMFRIKAKIPTEVLQKHIDQVKTGLPGIAYVRLDRTKPWPEDLEVRMPRE
ncbi:HlyD family secretion protein [Methyloligella solikamskensis]|uniref:HlyD family secretion protein n=1 Tax=Methyloligella solikamskensis TaxID=1177756 RepID=A0ABW3JAA1_9HYPH